MASSVCDSPDYWVKLITGGPVPNFLLTYPLGNLMQRVIQFIIIVCISSSLLLAKDPTSSPNILCSEPDRQELVQQFQQVDLEVEFVADFCKKFVPNYSRIPQKNKTKTKFLSHNQKSLRNRVQPHKLPNEDNEQGKLDPEQVLMAIFNSKDLTASGTSASLESYDQENDNPEILQNSVILKNQLISQIDTKDFTENNNHSTKSEDAKWDFSSGLIWQLNLGQAKTSFFETDTGTRLKGNHQEIRLQKFLTPILLLGVSQSYRNQKGTLRKKSLTRSVDLEQLQLLGNFGIAWEADNGLGLRGGLMGGWSENRLNYRLQEDEKAYFSDSIDNGQFTWGFEFGPTFKLVERWRAGLRWQKQNSITTVRFAEGNKATLHPLYTYSIWAEYIVETR